MTVAQPTRSPSEPPAHGRVPTTADRSEVETRPERRFVARLVVLRHGQNEQGHPRAYPNYSDAQGNVGEEVFRFCRVDVFLRAVWRAAAVAQIVLLALAHHA